MAIPMAEVPTLPQKKKKKGRIVYVLIDTGLQACIRIRNMYLFSAAILQPTVWYILWPEAGRDRVPEEGRPGRLHVTHGPWLYINNNIVKWYTV